MITQENEEVLYNEFYEKTKDCGRTQFVKLLMKQEEEKKKLKKELKILSDNYKEMDKFHKSSFLNRSNYIKQLEQENQQLKNELEQSNAVADTNKELAESYYKEIERLKGLLKCDYEDGQSIMAESTTENKQLKENNLAMQEEMARTWAKLEPKEDVIKQLLTYLDKNKLTLNNPNILDFYINVKKILNIEKSDNE